MHTGILWQVIYWSPILMLTALIALFLRRGLVREFPWFFGYIVVDWSKDVAEFVVYSGAFGGYPSLNYVYTYWTSHLIGSLFLLVAAYELSLTRLFPRFYKVSFYRHLFSLAAVMIAGLGLFAAYGERQLSVVPKVIHIADVLHVLALLFFVGLMQFMGRRWARYEFAIAAGLGVNAVAFVLWFVIFLKFGPGPPARDLPSVADFLTCLAWLITFLRPQDAGITLAAPVSPEILDQTRKWEEALKESFSRKRPAS